MNTHDSEQDNGKRLLTAVERILEDSESIIRFVQALEASTARGDSASAHRDAVAKKLITHYSNQTALAGGLTSLPAIVPGPGTLFAAFGGTLADVGLTLKFEVEMVLALTALYGFDIREETERKLAFLLASISPHDAKAGGNVLVDLAVAEGTALWTYAPRQITKLLITVLAKLLVRAASKGFFKALPVVGVFVGSSVNKVLTARVGRRCIEELAQRSTLRAKEAAEGKAEEKPATEPLSEVSAEKRAKEDRKKKEKEEREAAEREAAEKKVRQQREAAEAREAARAQERQEREAAEQKAAAERKERQEQEAAEQKAAAERKERQEQEAAEKKAAAKRAEQEAAEKREAEVGSPGAGDQEWTDADPLEDDSAADAPDEDEETPDPGGTLH